MNKIEQQNLEISIDKCFGNIIEILYRSKIGKEFNSKELKYKEITWYKNVSIRTKTYTFYKENPLFHNYVHRCIDILGAYFGLKEKVF